MQYYLNFTFRSILIWFHLICVDPALSQDKVSRLQHLVDSLCAEGNYPGLSVAVAYPDNTTQAYVSGFNDIEKGVKLSATDRLMQGSVGKTYVAAIALQLVEQKRLRLDERVSKYLGDNEWFSRLPNADDITVRMLMNHTSGIMRYEFKESFANDLNQNPDKVWKPEEQLAYVLDELPRFKAGQDWEYSDTNYIILGMIIEKISGTTYHKLLQDNILKPLGLNATLPSNRKKLQGLAQGYAGKDNPFGNREKMIGPNGDMIINPQFEWTGGGMYSTTSDLASWAKLLYEAKAFSQGSLDQMLAGVPAKLGKDTQYGLGVILRPTPWGITYGHSGFFPGYLTDMYYFPEHRLCIAVQTNSSDVRNLKFGLNKVATTIAKEILGNN